MSGPVWKGSRELQRDPSQEWGFADEDTYTTTFYGPYDVCLNLRPKRGDVMTASDGNFRVTRVSVKKQPGGKGALTISAARNSDEGDNASPGDGDEKPTYEVDWVEIEKALETHPIFEDLTARDLAEIEAWKNTEDPDLKQNYHYESKASTTGVGLSTTAQQYAAKYLKGIESYTLYAPVVRVTTPGVRRPDTESCGVRSDPPAEAEKPDGYEWTKTADRRMKTGTLGRWERFEEWTGAKSWDRDLYP